MVAIVASSSLFSALDKDGDGKVSARDLHNCMMNLSEEEEEAAAVFAAADVDGDGLLDLEEFLSMTREAEKGADDDSSCLREAFTMYTAAAEGGEPECITPASLMRMLTRLGQSNGMEECRAMICRFDLNGDGVLSFDEFRIMMHGGLI